MNIYKAVIAAGIPHDSHESDLYIPVNANTRAILETHPHRSNVTVFRSQIDGQLWFDVPFAFSPWWEQHQQRSAS